MKNNMTKKQHDQDRDTDDIPVYDPSTVSPRFNDMSRGDLINRVIDLENKVAQLERINYHLKEMQRWVVLNFLSHDQSSK